MVHWKRTVKGSKNFGVDLFSKLEYTIKIVLILCMLAEKTAASDSVEDVAHWCLWCCVSFIPWPSPTWEGGGLEVWSCVMSVRQRVDIQALNEGHWVMYQNFQVSMSKFTQCKQSKTGGVEGLGMKLLVMQYVDTDLPNVLLCSSHLQWCHARGQQLLSW